MEELAKQFAGLAAVRAFMVDSFGMSFWYKGRRYSVTKSADTYTVCHRGAKLYESTLTANIYHFITTQQQYNEQ